MALLNFGRKKDTIAPPPFNPTMVQSNLPINQVIAMREQGMSNNQIVQSLQREGFNSSQIFDAMNQSEMQAGSPMPQYDQGLQQPMQDNWQQGPQNMPPPPVSFQEEQPQQYPDYNPPTQFGGERERIEEMAEAIIDEKWDELIKNINKIVEWKDKTENRVTKIEQQMKDLKDTFDKLHHALIGKLSEYDQNILNVGTEIKAMERVFQKILPTLTENVGELSRITKNMKGKAPEK